MRTAAIAAAVIAAAVIAAESAAEAADYSKSCSRGDDSRVIAVLTPGVVGTACDMKYVREAGENVSVPYHADNSEDFCEEKARELVGSLVDAGYACEDMKIEAASIRRDAEAAPEPATETVAAAVAAPGSGDAAEESSAPFADETPTVAAEMESEAQPALTASLIETPPADSSHGVADSPEMQPAVLEQPALNAGVAADSFAAVKDDGLPERQPFRSTVASSGPVALTVSNASLPVSSRASRSSAVGRLVGAAPDYAPPRADLVAEERLQNATAPADAAAPPASVSAAPPPKPKPVPAVQPRPPEKIIENVLRAQAAAWNEGDLEAFMTGYWNSPDLRFISGTTVSKGWNKTLERYRERYGDGDSLGRLSFDALDIEMVTDDVAVVAGRFRLVRDASDAAGAFTLVMKRFGGVWRIVHDHSVGDAPSTE